MGALLVGAALNPEWAVRLTPTERLILHTMAFTAHDTGKENGQQPGEYWAGHEYLALVLYGTELTPTDNRYQVIKRAIRKLITTGAIQRVQQGTRGRRARYKLTLDLNQPTLEQGTQ